MYSTVPLHLILNTSFILMRCLELIMGSCNTRHIYPFSKVGGGSGENTILTWQQQTRPHNMRNQNYPTELYREGSIFWHVGGNHSAWRKSQGGTQIIFDGVVQLEVLNSYPYQRIFFLKKQLIWRFSFKNFCNRDPFLRVFLPQKRLILPFFPAIIVKWEPHIRIFFYQIETHI